jgi:hypothetical protein
MVIFPPAGLGAVAVGMDVFRSASADRAQRALEALRP